MLQNHFRIFVRNLRNAKLYSVINVAGLSIGMAACILILLFIQNELAFEKMHSRASQIYRVLTIDKALGTNKQRVGITMPALGPALPASFPEVTASLRLTDDGRVLLKYGDNPPIYAQHQRSADPNFFAFFDFPLLEGDPKTALQEPFSLVLTEKLARQIFDAEDPLNKTIRDGDNNNWRVTGIMADLPKNTHLEFDALASIVTISSLFQSSQPNQTPFLETWQSIAMPTYCMLAEGTSAKGLAEKFTRLARENGVSSNFEVALQPLLDVHLKSTDIIFDPVTNKGDENNVFIFSVIALLILIMASVNYMNLATARSTERAREVGIRKVVGSRRSQLVLQFLSESFFTTLLSLFLALPLAWFALPWLNNLTSGGLSINFFSNDLLLAFMAGLLLIVGALAGLYPTVVLASFRPVTVLKGSFKASKKGTALRIGLVVFQFALSISLIGATAVIQQQLRYIQNKDLGYDREQVMLLDLVDQSMGQRLDALRQRLDSQSAFVSVAAASNVPGRTFGRTRVMPEGVPDDEIWIWSVFSASPETLPTLGMSMAMGRNFSREMATDTVDAVIINQTAAQQLGWQEPLNRRLYFGPNDSTGTRIIGVVKDFHFAGLHQNIEPLVIFPLASFPGNMLVARIQPGRIPEAMEMAEQAWHEVYPDYPFSFSFLNEEFDALYRRDLNTAEIVDVFSALAILIACLGLFGLASHAISQRTKEIGVRKVVGASSIAIARQLVVDFVRWVALANLLAWPLAWYAASAWLQSFAYRISLTALPLLLASLVALVIAILTVLSQSLRAAAINPARALRYE